MQFEELVTQYIFNDSEDLKKIIEEKIANGSIQGIDNSEPKDLIKQKVRKDSSIVILYTIVKLTERMKTDKENRDRIQEVRDFVFDEFKKSIAEEVEEEKNRKNSALPRKK